MHRNLTLTACAIVQLATTPAHTASTQVSEGHIVLSREQLTAARAAFTSAVPIDITMAGTIPDGASLRLAGRVVVPNSALELVLAPVAGRVEALLVNPGQSVRVGQSLARIHSAEILTLQRELLGARVQAATARARAVRDEQLHDEGIISRNRLEESRAQLVAGEAMLREQDQLLQLAGFSANAIARITTADDISPVVTVSARRAGTVLQQTTGPGEYTSAGQPMFRLGMLHSLWVELQATRDQAARISAGDAVAIAGCPRAGHVMATAPLLDSQSQTATVRAELSGSTNCLTPNQYVEAQVTPRLPPGSLVSVPVGSLVQRQGRTYVFRREPAGLLPVPVVVERRTAASAWIAGEIRPGEAVASAGLAAIKGAWLGLGAATDGAEEHQ